MSANEEPKIEVGQVWKRRRDGVLVRISAYYRTTGEAYWRSLDEPFTKKGSLYFRNLWTRYELVGGTE